jgi:hypothetical protein
MPGLAGIVVVPAIVAAAVCFLWRLGPGLEQEKQSAYRQ